MNNWVDMVLENGDGHRYLKDLLEAVPQFDLELSRIVAYETLLGRSTFRPEFI